MDLAMSRRLAKALKAGTKHSHGDDEDDEEDEDQNRSGSDRLEEWNDDQIERAVRLLATKGSPEASTLRQLYETVRDETNVKIRFIAAVGYLRLGNPNFEKHESALARSLKVLRSNVNSGQIPAEFRRLARSLLAANGNDKLFKTSAKSSSKADCSDSLDTSQSPKKRKKE
jgi:hypothetical protein